VKIEDRRVTSSWVPAVQILEEVIPLFRQEHFGGIRRIVLLDHDYHANRRVARASGRYCPIKGTKAADVEIYFSHLSTLPEEVKTNQMLLTYLITETLMHEIYHHLVRGQQKLRRPSFKQEQKAAGRWAFAAVCHVFRRLFPGEDADAEWKRIDQILKQASPPGPQKQ
jgi:hypothetical protein